MEVLHIPVTLQKLEKSGPRDIRPGEQHRVHVGTSYFQAGTTVNEVLIFISERQRKVTGGMGFWLLQRAAANPSIGNSAGDVVDGDAFTTIKDSKHCLQDDGTRYVALHYTSPDIFLM
jgi:hypothetical protein